MVAKLNCCLYPGVEVLLVLWLQCFLHLMVGVPVNACDEILVMWSAGKSVDSLVFGLLKQCSLKLPPRVLEG